MLIRSLILLALRNVLRHLRHSVFSLAAIAAGVAALALADGFVQDVYHQLRESTVRGQLGHLQVSMPGFREAGAGNPEAYLLPKAAALSKAIRADERVASVMSRLYLSALLNAGERDLPVEVEAVEPVPEAAMATQIQLIGGRDLAAGGRYGLLVGEGVAQRFGLKAGDSVTLTASTAQGAMNSVDLQVAGVFRSFSKEYDDRVVRVWLPTAQELIDSSGVNVVVVQLKATEQTDAVLSAIRAGPAGQGVDVQPWYRLSEFYANTRLLYERQFGVLQAIAIVLIAMSVYASFNITIYQRTAEFGTMRVLGTKGPRLFAMILVEALILGVIGGVLGALLAGAISGIVGLFGIDMPAPPNSELGYVAYLRLRPEAVALSVGLGAVSAAIGCLPPLSRALRMPLVNALGRGI